MGTGAPSLLAASIGFVEYHAANGVVRSITSDHFSNTKKFLDPD